MAALLAWASALLPLGYLALAADYGATFLLRRRPQGRSPLVPALVGVHAVFLVLWGVALGRPPITTTAEVLSVLAAAMAAVYAWVELATRDRRTGLFILTLAFLFQYASTVLSARHPLAPSAGVAAPAGPSAAVHLWGALHVVLALVAYTALGFAGVYGGLYLTARRNLRRHRFGVLFDRLPPLEALGAMAWHALATGFVAMTLSIAVAPLMMGTEGAGMTAKVVAKIVAGSAAWLVCAAAVFGRWLGRWSPTRVSAVGVLGFLAVMVLLAVSGALS